MFDKLFHYINQAWTFELYKSGESVVRLSQVVIALFVIIVGIVVSRRLAAAAGKRLEKISRLDSSTVYFLQKLSFYFLVVVIVLVALPIAGIPITIFTVIGGAVAIGVGFGAQNLCNNLISGIIIMLERPIRLGDIVELSGREGRVAEINSRCVRVRRSDGVDLLVPNSYFLEQPVVNWTLSDNNVRGELSVGVAYGSPAKLVSELIMQAASEHAKIREVPPPTVLFEDFGDNALVFTLLFWSRINRPMDLREVQSELRYRITALFQEHDIAIAFPQRDIHLDISKPLEVELLRSSG